MFEKVCSVFSGVWGVCSSVCKSRLEREFDTYRDSVVNILQKAKRNKDDTLVAIFEGEIATIKKTQEGLDKTFNSIQREHIIDNENGGRFAVARSDVELAFGTFYKSYLEVLKTSTDVGPFVEAAGGQIVFRAYGLKGYAFHCLWLMQEKFENGEDLKAFELPPVPSNDELFTLGAPRWKYPVNPLRRDPPPARPP